MAKSNKALALVKKQKSQALRRTRLYKEQYEKYAPNIASVATTAAGGALAGAVNSGRVLPATLGGFSTPLILGGALSAYAIYAGGDIRDDNDNLAKFAASLGGGMIAVWAASYTEDMLALQDNNNNNQSVSPLFG